MINNICLLRCVKHKQPFLLFSPINAGNRGGLQQFSIIQPTIDMERYQTQRNLKGQSSAQIGGKHQISSHLEDLLKILRTHPNPFLVRDVKSFLRSINVGKGEYEIPKYFHPQITNKVEAVLMVLSNPERQRDQIQTLHQKVSSLREHPSKLWEAADLLMSTPTVKSLSASFADELMQLLLVGNQTKLNDFFDRRYNKKDLSKEELDNDVKLFKLDSKPIRNLSTLISQIFKRKPEQNLHQEAPNSKVSELLEKLQDLNKQKTDLIEKMGGEYQAIFQLQLRNIIEHNKTMGSQELCHHLTELKHDTSKVSEFQKDVKTIKQLQKGLGTEFSQDAIILDVLTMANYKDLCQKPQSLSTVNIVTNLSKAEEFSKALQDKDMIAFFGMTGAGKSTSVNYFLGIPLANCENELNQNIVKISDQSQFQKKIPRAKIGENINISETIFSQGYKIISQESSDQFEDVILCDNPGFGDTRGSDMIICTNMSIDESVEKCRSIKAIVLVIPFECFKIDRGTSLVQLITLIQQRFPDVLKEGSSTNKCFHILVTKWNHCPKQIKKIRGLLETIIDEENKNNTKDLGNGSESSLLKQRRFKIEIFQGLAHLHNQGRFKFIDVEDSFERQQILDKYLGSKVSVNKSEYVKAMESRSMQETFSKQISSLAHTWTENIINNYFVQIPKAIQEEKDNLQKTRKEIVQKSKNIALQESNLEAKVKYCGDLQSTTLPNAIRESERVNNNGFTIYEHLKMQCQDQEKIKEKIRNIPELTKESQLKIQRYKVDTQNKLKIILRDVERNGYNYVDIAKQLLIQFQLNNQIKIIGLQILELQLKNVTVNIYSSSCSLGQIKSAGSINYSYEQRMDYLKKGENLPVLRSYDVTFKAGYQKRDTCQVVSINKEFVLFPHKQFDPKGYIAKSRLGKYSVEGYQARIDSRNVTLEGVNLDPSGKKITLSLLFHYSDNQKSESVPYIKIDHVIPKKNYNQGLIRDKQSQKTVLEQKLRDSSNTIKYKQADIEKYNNQMNNQTKALESSYNMIAEQKRRNQQRVSVETQRLRNEDIKNKIVLLKKQKQQVVLNLKTDIKKVQGEIDNLNKAIKDGKRSLWELEKKKLYQQGLIADKLFLLKRYQYLVKDQVRKNVPQCMEKFVKRAYTLNKDISTDKKSSRDAVSLASGYLANFIRFSEMYSEHSKAMEAL